MPEYNVIWEITLDANNSRAAAEQALRIQRDPESTATAFRVERVGTDSAELIDLDAEEERQ